MVNGFRARGCIYGPPKDVDRLLNDIARDGNELLVILDEFIKIIDFEDITIIDFKVNFIESELTQPGEIDAWSAVAVWHNLVNTSDKRWGLKSQFIMLDHGSRIMEWDDVYGSESRELLNVKYKIISEY